MTGVMLTVNFKRENCRGSCAPPENVPKAGSCLYAAYLEPIRAVFNLDRTDEQAVARISAIAKFAMRGRDDYHDGEGSLILWDIRQTIPRKSMNAS